MVIERIEEIKRIDMTRKKKQNKQQNKQQNSPEEHIPTINIKLSDDDGRELFLNREFSFNTVINEQQINIFIEIKD